MALHRMNQRVQRAFLSYCGTVALDVKTMCQLPLSTFAGTGTSDLPRITCPQKIMERMEKSSRRKQVGQSSNRKRKPKGPLLISCKRKDYNFHAGEHFDERNPESLVSCGWKNTKRVGDHFTLVAHAENPSFSDEASTFQELGISEDLCSGLSQLNLTAPTQIQQLAIPHMMDGENVIIAAETGSGKTLSYLLPCIEWIQRGGERGMCEADCPRAVVLSPSRELSEQIMSVAESLMPYSQFQAQCSHRERPVEVSEDCGMDLLITTPGQLNWLLQKRLVKGRHLQHLVIDESDTILDDSFVKDLQEIFWRLSIVPAEEVSESQGRFSPQPPPPPHTPAHARLVGTQMALVSATKPRNLQEALGTLVPVDSFVKVNTNALHRLPPHISQKFIRISPDGKPEKLVQILQQSSDKKHTCMVFVKDNKTCFYVASMLGEMGMKCLQLNGHLSAKNREGVYSQFVEGHADILVATDIASRGLDTAHVSQVVNYDFPQHMSDYIHRVGRVGRVGSLQTGQVISLVSHKWDVDLLWKIEIAARKGTLLGDVNANIKKRLSGLKRHKDRFELNVVG